MTTKLVGWPLAILTTALSLGACAAQQAQRPSRLALADCASLDASATLQTLYAPGKIKQVEPIHRQEFVARAIQPRYVAGARMYVPAEPGVTGAALERALICHAASSHELHDSDPLRVAGQVRVSVSEYGPTLRVSVVGEDRSAGRTILERAQQLQDQPAHVSVEQLSQSTLRPAF